ncbi:MAG: DUF72 domain-containing protein [Gemmatimonadetes bacterium]|nr:DUF72 domain-containing protein [Gemmatimonadota bacterium]
MTQLRIGISGWTYAGWRGVFYPERLAHRRELEYASRKFNSIEINGSFYSLQTPSSYRRWYAETPPDFVFAVKGGRFITHMKKLRDVEVPVANFFASGVLALEEKLGPVLWQFPAQFAYSEERFARFLELLPRTTGAAAELACGHDERLQGRSCTEVFDDAPLRHAFEVRNPGFMVPSFIDLLRRHGAGLVLADTAGIWPYAEDLTADFVYIRLHGAEALYTSGYSDEQLDWWARRIRLWRAGTQPADATLAAPGLDPSPGERDIYVYFDNDAKVHAPFDATRLAERLS